MSQDASESNCKEVSRLSNGSQYDTYVVKGSDTIESVAALFNMTPSKLCHLNKLFARTIFVNQKLKVIKTDEFDSDSMRDKENVDSSKCTSPTSLEFNDELSASLNNEAELFPLLYLDSYLKVPVKYITDTEGVINGKLLLTPEALTFIPGLNDPVIREYGVDKFTIHLPNSKIACVSMYNDSDVMAYKRSQRLVSNKIIVPTQKPGILDTNSSNTSPVSHSEDDIKTHKKLSLIVENEDDHVNESVSKPVEKRISFHNYLCVIASPRYRKTKVIYQQEDEYWFMIPICSTDEVLEYLLINGRNQYGVGANVDSHWPGESNSPSCGSSPLSKDFLSRTSSFAKMESVHNDSVESECADFKSQFGLLRERSMDWEIINNDFDLSYCDEPELIESQILNSDQAKELMSQMPIESIGAKWELIYGTSRDGWSLRTMYRNVFESTRNACILIIQDNKSNIFGALCNSYIRISKCFYGNGTTFVFRWSPDFQVFKCTMKNNYILYGEPDYFVVGSCNSRNAIRLNSSLSEGISQSCETFDSPPLTDEEFFHTISIEVWSFY